MTQSTSTCVACGTGVRSRLLYLEPQSGFARQKATRTRKLTNSKRLSCASAGGVSFCSLLAIASAIGSHGSFFLARGEKDPSFLTPATREWRSAEPEAAMAACESGWG